MEFIWHGALAKDSAIPTGFRGFFFLSIPDLEGLLVPIDNVSLGLLEATKKVNLYNLYIIYRNK